MIGAIAQIMIALTFGVRLSTKCIFHIFSDQGYVIWMFPFARIRASLDNASACLCFKHSVVVWLHKYAYLSTFALFDAHIHYETLLSAMAFGLDCLQASYLQLRQVTIRSKTRSTLILWPVALWFTLTSLFGWKWYWMNGIYKISSWCILQHHLCYRQNRPWLHPVHPITAWLLSIENLVANLATARFFRHSVLRENQSHCTILDKSVTSVLTLNFYHSVGRLNSSSDFNCGHKQKLYIPIIISSDLSKM